MKRVCFVGGGGKKKIREATVCEPALERCVYIDNVKNGEKLIGGILESERGANGSLGAEQAVLGSARSQGQEW